MADMGDYWKDVKQEIKLFMEWLKELNLLEIYQENWESNRHYL